MELGQTRAATYTPAGLDSALMITGLIVSRYDDGAYGKADVKPIIHAMIMQSFIYNLHYNDNTRAYNLLRRAAHLIALYPEHRELLSFVNINMGVLVRENEIVLSHLKPGSGSEYFVKALDECLRSGQWHGATVAIFDLTEALFDDGLTAELEPHARKWLRQVPDSVRQAYAPVADMLHGVALYNRNDFEGASRLFERIKAPIDSDPELERSLNLKSYYYRALAAEKSGLRSKADCMLDSLSQAVAANDDAMIGIWHQAMLERFYRTLRGDSIAAERARMGYYLARHEHEVNPDFHSIRQLNFEESLDSLRRMSTRDITRRRLTSTLTVSAGVIALVVIVALLLLLRASRRKHRLLKALYEQTMRRLECPVPHPAPAAEEDISSPHVAQPLIDEQTYETLRTRIGNVMDDVTQFTAPDFSLRTLASAVGSNTAYVSQVINRTTGRTFKEILVEKRIAEACRRLADRDAYGNFTVEAIANEVGFKSRTSFAAVFRSVTGLTPTEFRKMANDGR